MTFAIITIHKIGKIGTTTLKRGGALAGVLCAMLELREKTDRYNPATM